MKTFDPSELAKLYHPLGASTNEENGQITIIGGSSLFHGAPILALKVASRIVDMVFFASPEESVGRVAEQLKAQLSSFIWVPWDEVDAYIEKSDSVLIGPGFLRYRSEKKQVTGNKLDRAGEKTREITERLLKRFPNKHWVIDAGSLQVMEPGWIPENAILTPNRKEFEILFNIKNEISNIQNTNQNSKIREIVSDKAREYNCIIVLKGETTIVCSPEECVWVQGGNPGLTKGGTGDVQAGLTVALVAKNEPFLAATTAAWIIKKAADELYERVRIVYNADDVADQIPKVIGQYLY